MLKLYTSPGACSTACHIALQESGIPFETKMVSFDKGDMDTAEMKKYNPKGYVPFLEIDSSRRLNEGTAILQFIADQAPTANLMPAKGYERAKAQEWLNYVATEMHKPFGSLFAIDQIFTSEEGKKEYRKFVEGAFNEKLAYVNEQLEGKNYLMGDTFCVADAYLFTILSWSPYLKFDLSPYKNVTNFQSRVYARPGTQRAFKAEGLLK